MIQFPLLAAAALLAGQPPVASPATGALPPSGKWLVEGQDNMCALSHAYGEGARQVTLAVRPWPIGSRTDVLLFRHGTQADPDTGAGWVEPGTSGRKWDGSFTSYAIKGREVNLYSLDVQELPVAALADAGTIAIAFGKSRPVVVAQTGTKAAYAALAQCEDMLLKSLNVDPAVLANAATPARRMEGWPSWFRREDYPNSAISGGAQGSTSMLLTVDTGGSVVGCTTFGRSGNAAIDKAACAAVTRRGRYIPAIGKNGQPTRFYDTMRVSWVLRQLP